MHCYSLITTWQLRDGTQGVIFMCYKQYHGNQALQVNMARVGKGDTGYVNTLK